MAWGRDWMPWYKVCKSPLNQGANILIDFDYYVEKSKWVLLCGTLNIVNVWDWKGNTTEVFIFKCAFL